LAEEEALASEAYCYVTTTARRSGQPREIEIWFALLERTVYLLAGGGERANSVQNLREEPHALVQIGDRSFTARAREPEAGDEANAARRALFKKYSTSGRNLRRWRDQGLLMVLDLE
jgi:F420H(2)-dependent quinone reductase